MIAPLSHPDSFYLNAAKGWFELGNYIEANEELDRITPKLRAHPDVLALRYQIYEKAGKWTLCHDIAQTLTELLPEDRDGWVSLSIAKYRLGRTEEAYVTLEPCLDKHPLDWRVHYNLACYATQLGKLREAEKLLQKAIILGDAKEVQLLILNDPDLKPLREEFKL